MSPALAGGFFAAEPSGKPHNDQNSHFPECDGSKWWRTSCYSHVTDALAASATASFSHNSPWLLVSTIPGFLPSPIHFCPFHPFCCLSACVPSSKKPSVTTQLEWLPLLSSYASEQPVPFLPSTSHSLLINCHPVPTQGRKFLGSQDSVPDWPLSPQCRAQQQLYRYYSIHFLNDFDWMNFIPKRNPMVWTDLQSDTYLCLCWEAHSKRSF